CCPPKLLWTLRATTTGSAGGDAAGVLSKEHQNEPDEYDVGHDDEQRGHYDRVGRGPSDTGGAAAGGHALKRRDGSDDESKDRCLERWRQHVTESHIAH